MEFKGYRRGDGTYGIRNHVVVLSSVACANGVVARIASEVPQAVPITHGYGCGIGPADFGPHHKTFSGIGMNPNVGAVLIVGLGCEALQSSFLADGMSEAGIPVETIVIQESGGSRKTAEKGAEIVRKLVRKTRRQRREPAPLESLVVGLECGGSDAFSGITANPAVGAAADLLVEQGCTVILAETFEMIGTSHILKRRAVNKRVGDRVENLIKSAEKEAKRALGKQAGLLLAPGNIEGGLSSITEKSLGCITKGGTTTVNEVVEYATAPTKKGLVIMDTPGYDIESMTGLAAGGAQLILFTTGRGSPAGFPAVPVIKVMSNTATYRRVRGDIDVNAGRIVDEGVDIDDVGREIFQLVRKVADGRRTRAEINKQDCFGILKQGMSF